MNIIEYLAALPLFSRGVEITCRIYTAGSFRKQQSECHKTAKGFLAASVYAVAEAAHRDVQAFYEALEKGNLSSAN